MCIVDRRQPRSASAKCSTRIRDSAQAIQLLKKPIKRYGRRPKPVNCIRASDIVSAVVNADLLVLLLPRFLIDMLAH